MNKPEFNDERPLIMHIDLNSCFATVEQQARPMLRGKPIAIVNRRTEHTAIITASYEAKAMGVKVGMKLKEARLLCPDILALESDPSKYRHVYHKLLDIMRDYSAHVTMKSIDEGIIDFHNTSADIAGRDLVEIGMEIKQRLKDEIGVWMRCNIGISTNRFLAKTAAGLHKPDGLDVLTSQNIKETLGELKLLDLTGIAHRNQQRLNSVGIFTPLQFLDANVTTLQKVVFKSVVGVWWYKRLRGWEVDDVETKLGRVGRQYVLERFDLSHTEVLQRLHHLCESVGSRMRSQNLAARGIYVYAKTLEREYWHSSALTPLPFFSDQSIYAQAQHLMEKAPTGLKEIGIHCYELVPIEDDQMSLFADQITHERHVVEAIDDVNKRYGERTLHSADTLGTGIYVSQKIPFGSTRYL
ncbi:MAG: Nucleotidyltransferase/DNA polymerase involved in repair [Candidatus Saccharibacteria bacterium]|nr:Nucleotidyltransferase/DNA polymerase involved in repair [Candidatus Saccharibacteria bacterium]MDB5180553.1 Nucleotidyltransferase/DNA polymerase involved in repair [Candidatus Saccharibacteria bacterium]